MKFVISNRSSHPNNNRNDKSWLFRIVAKGLKYYLLMLFGFVVSLVVATVIGVFPLIEYSIPVVWELFWRLAMILLCLGAIAVVFESVRQ